MTDWSAKWLRSGQVCVCARVLLLLQIIMRTGYSQDKKCMVACTDAINQRAVTTGWARVLYLSPYTATLSLRWWFNFICIQIHTLTDLINFRIYNQAGCECWSAIRAPALGQTRAPQRARVINFRSRRPRLCSATMDYFGASQSPAARWFVDVNKSDSA